MDLRRRRRTARTTVPVLLVSVFVVVAAVGDASATRIDAMCAYETTRETCSSWRGFTETTADVACGAPMGHVACDARGNGVRFDPDEEHQLEMDGYGTIEALRRSGGSFTIEVAARLATRYDLHPLVTLAIGPWAYGEAFTCAAVETGFYLSLYVRYARVVVEMRVPWDSSDAFYCATSESPSSAELTVGDIHRIGVVYDKDSLSQKIFVNGTQVYPVVGGNDAPLSRLDVMGAVDARQSRIVVGEFGQKYFNGTMYAVRIYDRALNATEMMLTSEEPLPNSKPVPVSQTLTIDEDQGVAIDFVAWDVDGDEVSFEIDTLPLRGTLYDRMPDGGVDEMIEITRDMTPYRLRSSGVWFEPFPNEYSAAGREYARILFNAYDGQSASSENGRVVVHVDNVNDVPTSVSSHVVVTGKFAARFQLSFLDEDGTCPPNVVPCTGDAVASVLITRAPTKGDVYTCNHYGTSQPILNGTYVTASSVGEDILCFVYSFGEQTTAIDSMEYVVIDRYGGSSEPTEVDFRIVHPCASLGRHQTVMEDEVSSITITVVCVVDDTTTVSTEMVRMPIHGQISSTSGENCSSTQHALCDAWGQERSTVDEQRSLVCLCSSFTYTPEADYFNLPGTDIYGHSMHLGGTPAAHWNVGQSDTFQITLETSDGWMTAPFISHIWVKNVADAPEVRIREDALRQIGAIEPGTESDVLTNMIAIDINPDYDAFAMRVNIRSAYAEALRLVRNSDDLLVNERPDSRTIQISGSPSLVSKTLKEASIIYIPGDTNTTAFTDTVYISIFIGGVPWTLCSEPNSSALCFTGISLTEYPCSTPSPSQLPCAIERTLSISIAAAPDYKDLLSALQDNRTPAELARAVFLIWFIATVILIQILRKLFEGVKRAMRIGAFSF